MNGVKLGWPKKTLRQVADFIMGQAPPGSECNFDGHGTPFVKAGEFQEIRPIVREWTTRPLKLAKKTDVLICVVGATSGKLNLGADCAIGRSVAAIRPKHDTFAEFLYYQLLAMVQALRAGSTGSAQGVISKEVLASIEIPLPPIDEQRRIVAKLGNLFGHSKGAREELSVMPRLIGRYKKAILAAAFRGDLTADWRKSNRGNADYFLKRERMHPLDSKDLPRLPSGWSWVAVGTICAVKGGVALGKKRATGAMLLERPSLRVANVQRGWLNLDEIKTIAVTQKEAESLAKFPCDAGGPLFF